MAHTNRRRRGGQPGNQNASKHGCYSASPTVDQTDALPAAAMLKELDHDLAIARYKLRALLRKDPENFKLIGYLISLQNRLVRTKRLFQDHRRAVSRSRSVRTRQKTNHSQRKSC